MSTTDISNRPRLEPNPRLRWFKEGELKCAWPTCSKPMPAGYYGKQKRVYYCSHRCFHLCFFGRKKPLKCLYCGDLFQPRMSNEGKPFCTKEHGAAWRRDRSDKRRFGRFAPLVNEYLTDAKSRLLSPGSLDCLRNNLAVFFVFILRKRIRSLESVRPHHVTDFMAEHRLRSPKSAGRAAIDVHRFFEWMIELGKRKASNPVVLSFHGQKQARGNPRPYSPEQIALIRSLIESAGDPQLKLAIEIGSESALRISETCNLRMSDFDLDRQHFFVRLPNKTRVERFVPFHTRTREALLAWFKQRPAADHDFLFVCQGNKPMREYTLRLCLKRVLCGPGRLNSFSYHRLRHTASSAVYPAMDMKSVMRTFGWKSQSVAQGYTQVDPVALRKAYFRAMDRLGKEDVQSRPNSRSIEAYFGSAGIPK